MGMRSMVWSGSKWLVGHFHRQHSIRDVCTHFSEPLNRQLDGPKQQSSPGLSSPFSFPAMSVSTFCSRLRPQPVPEHTAYGGHWVPRPHCSRRAREDGRKKQGLSVCYVSIPQASPASRETGRKFRKEEVRKFPHSKQSSVAERWPSHKLSSPSEPLGSW